MPKEAKVGAIILLILGLLVYSAPSSSTRDSGLLGGQYKLLFDEVCGLTVNSDVKVSGFSVGTVTDINFTSREIRDTYGEDMAVIVTIATDYDVVIPKDSSASIGSKTGYGSWVDITPGLSQEALPRQSISKLRILTPPTEQLTAGLANLTALHANTAELREAVRDPRFRREMRDMASNARFYTTEIRKTGNQAQRYVAGVDKRLDQAQNAMLQQLERVDVQVSQAGARLEGLLPKVTESVEQWQGRISRADVQITRLVKIADQEIKRFNQIAAQAQQALKDPQMAHQLVQKLHQLAPKLENIAEISDTVAAVIGSPEAKQALRDLAAKYRQQSADMRDKIRAWEAKLPGDGAPVQDNTIYTPLPPPRYPAPTTFEEVPAAVNQIPAAAPAPSTPLTQEAPAIEVEPELLPGKPSDAAETDSDEPLPPPTLPASDSSAWPSKTYHR